MTKISSIGEHWPTVKFENGGEITFVSFDPNTEGLSMLGENPQEVLEKYLQYLKGLDPTGKNLFRIPFIQWYTEIYLVQ